MPRVSLTLVSTSHERAGRSVAELVEEAARRLVSLPPREVRFELADGAVLVDIREEDELRFLAAMSERKRIRRRDGALNWRLLRDLSDPEIWVERYETPTWLDYLRLNNRMTRNDAVIPESLRALHRGPEGPRVRRMIERPAAPADPAAG